MELHYSTEQMYSTQQRFNDALNHVPHCTDTVRRAYRTALGEAIFNICYLEVLQCGGGI